MKSLKDFICESKLDSLVSKCKTFGDVMKNFMGITTDPKEHPVKAEEDLVDLFNITDMPHLFKKPGDKDYWINPDSTVDSTEAAKEYLEWWYHEVTIDVKSQRNCDTLVVKMKNFDPKFKTEFDVVV